jgi:hypothetical protein
MSKQRAFVRYTKSGKIVPGSMIVTNGDYPKGPAVWKEVSTNICCEDTFYSTSLRLKGFIRYTKSGKIVPGSLVIGNSYPKDGGIWKEVSVDTCCEDNCIQFDVDTTEGTSFGFSFFSTSPINFTVNWGDGTTHVDAGAGGFYEELHEFPEINQSYTVTVCFDLIEAVSELNFYGND